MRKRERKMEREKEKYAYMYKESEKDRSMERLRERFSFLIFIDFIASFTLINVTFNSILIIFMYFFIYLFIYQVVDIMAIMRQSGVIADEIGKNTTS